MYLLYIYRYWMVYLWDLVRSACQRCHTQDLLSSSHPYNAVWHSLCSLSLMIPVCTGIRYSMGFFLMVLINYRCGKNFYLNRKLWEITPALSDECFIVFHSVWQSLIDYKTDCDLLTLYYEIYSKLYDNRRVDNIKFVIANCWKVFCLITEVY